MKYIYQITLILGFSFLGELLSYYLPLPIPASVYGMILMFLALTLKIIKVDMVKDAGQFLVGIISVLFVAPAVGLIAHWSDIAPKLIPILLIVLSSTCLIFGISGLITQGVMKKEDGKDA